MSRGPESLNKMVRTIPPEFDSGTDHNQPVGFKSFDGDQFTVLA